MRSYFNNMTLRCLTKCWGKETKEGNDFMGLRFRKSFKITPGLKLNLNKKSIGLTTGTKGAHFTVNSNGKKTASVGIPGTGLSYTASSSNKKNRKKVSTTSQTPLNKNNFENNGGKKGKKKHGCLTYIICIFLMLGFASCMLSSEELESASISANTSKIYDINSDVEIKVTTTPENYLFTEDNFIITGGKINIEENEITFSSSDEGSYTIYIESGDIKSNKIEIKFEDKKSIAEAKKKAEEEARIKAEQEAQAKAEEEARIQAEQEAQAKAEEEARIKAEQEAQAKAEEARIQAEQETQINTTYDTQQQTTPVGDMVWIAGSGKKYHRKSDCGNMNPDNAIQMTREEAESKGYTPCKKCY